MERAVNTGERTRSNNRAARDEGHRRQAARLGLVGLLMLPTTLLGGCAGHFKSLRTAAEIPDLGSLAQDAENLPAEIRYIEVGEVAGEPLRLAIEDIGSGASAIGKPGARARR